MNIRVHNYHLDGYGHVNHARYLEFLEEARWSFFDEHDLLPLLDNLQLVVARIDIRYRYPAVAGNELNIRNQINVLTTRHMVLTQTIERLDNGKHVVEAEITLMPVNTTTGRSMSFPANLLTSLKALA